MAAYTTIDDAGSFFNPVLYTGTGAELVISGAGFQPDLIWNKERSGTEGQNWTDAVRGATKYVMSNNTDGESTNAESVKSFDSDGFTLGTFDGMNTNTETYVSWNWKAGTTSGLSGGTITPTGYSINTTSGFGIYLYTGTNVNATIAHGLGVAPNLVIIKRLTSGAGWLVQDTSLTSADYIIKLNSSDAESSDSANFNGTFPTSTVFSVGTSNNTNKTGDAHIAYVFANVQGYSKFSSYIGNGNADGPFVYTGFRPAFVIVKRRDSGTHWFTYDDKRQGYNAKQSWLYANSGSAENTTGGTINLLSNGFKLTSSEADLNNSGSVILYVAFAQSPFVNSEGVPTNAR